MIQTLTKSLQATDYDEFPAEKNEVEEMCRTLWRQGYRIDMGHPHRFWEYGRAIAALVSMYGETLQSCKVLDVGSGWSPLGPALSFRYGVDVTEYEPDEQAYQDREQVASFLKKRVPTFKHYKAGLENLPNEKFDAVFCVSVLEHVQPELEKRAWDELGKCVKPSGMLYITVDCVPEVGKAYAFDNLRRTNYTVDMLRSRIEAMMDKGFVPMGMPDYVYHGNTVYDYTFFSIGFLKGTVDL